MRSTRATLRGLGALGAVVALGFGARGLAAQAADSTPRVNPAWLRVDPKGKTVGFDLVAGLTSANGRHNFNGFTAGTLRLTVPKGWRVALAYRNADSSTAHSAEVIQEATEIPSGPVPPVFARAFTIRLVDGLPPQAVDTMRFIPDKAGSYLIYCAMPGHGTAGEWMRLYVGEKGTTPAVDVVKP